jgi:hypothetical protein
MKAGCFSTASPPQSQGVDEEVVGQLQIVFSEINPFNGQYAFSFSM